MHDALAGLPRLKGEELTNCVGCDKPLIQPGTIPLFYRLRMQRAVIDAQAIRERIGLMQIWGGGRETAPLAEVFASKDPGVIMDDVGIANVCMSCAAKMPLDQLYLQAIAIECEKDG